MSVLFECTIERKRNLENRGYTVVDIWECEYKQMRKTDKDLKLFDKIIFRVWMYERRCLKTRFYLK